MIPNEVSGGTEHGSKRRTSTGFWVLAAALLLPMIGRPLTAQASAPADSQAITVWLMTMGPGDAVWERFGHNAIRVHDARSGEDRVYNWGMFSLDDTGFILRFLRGRMRYWMASEDASLTVEAYRHYNRSVTIQELNLTGAQKVALYEFVKRNELPENRYYDYDYFRDNCSTRVRDALDSALGGILAARYKSQGTDQSYRDHARRLMQPDILTYTGIDIGLGRPTDHKISAWDEMFIPMSLQRLVRDARVVRGGQDAPLVLNEQVLFESTRAPVSERPSPWTLRFLLVGCLVGILVLSAGLTRAAPVATVFGVIWSSVAGIVGLVLVFLWAFTAHVAAHENANLLPLNPVWLVLAGLIAVGSRKARTLAVWLTLAAYAAIILWLVPDNQDTQRVLALILPIHTAVMLATARRVRLSRT